MQPARFSLPAWLILPTCDKRTVTVLKVGGRSDTDELIFFERQKNESTGGLNVTVDPDPDRGAKVRGIFKPFSFHIDRDRTVTLHDKLIAVPDYAASATPTATDGEILEAVAKFLAEAGEPVSQNILVDHIRAVTGAGRDRVRTTIVVNSMKEGDKGGRQFIYTMGSRGRLDYSLPRQREQSNLFENDPVFRENPASTHSQLSRKVRGGLGES